MKTSTRRLISAAGFAFVVALVPLSAQSPPDTVDAHVAAARAAARQDHLGLFNRLCTPEPARPAQPAAATQKPAPPRPPGPPAKSTWEADAVKVFDNLYFVGEKEYSAWAVATSDGIIILDTIFEYSVDSQIVGGLRKLGLDPTTIKYAIVSHGHRDHSGGAQYLQDSFKTRVLLSAADWDMLEKNTRDPAKPKRDMVVTDGQKLTLGNQTLTLYITPGHTPGTVSTLVPVFDNGKPHLAAAWGGTAFNFHPLERTVPDLHRLGPALQRHRRQGRRGCADLEPHDLRRLQDQTAGHGDTKARRPASVRDWHRERPQVSQGGRRVRDGGRCCGCT